MYIYVHYIDREPILLRGTDVFVVLPTKFGNSDIHQVFDEITSLW